MLKYASKTRLTVFTILSIIGFIILVAGVVLSIVHDSFVYECGAVLVMLTITSIWSLLLDRTEKLNDIDNVN